MSNEHTIDDSDSSLQWNGQWVTEQDGAYEEGSWHSTTQEGASLVFSITGTGVSVYGGSGPDFGAFEVQCDNESVTNNAHSDEVRVSVLLFQRSDWEHGEHACTVTNVGSNKLAIDAIAVERASASTSSSSASSSASSTAAGVKTEARSTPAESSRESSSSNRSEASYSATAPRSSTASVSMGTTKDDTGVLLAPTAPSSSNSQSDSSSDTTRNAAIIGGIAGAAVGLLALVFIVWRCAKRRDATRHPESYSTAHSDDDKGLTTRDIGAPMFQGSTMEPPGSAGAQHQVQFPSSARDGGDSGDSDFKPHPFAAQPGPVSAFTMADGSNVEVAKLPKEPDSPTFSIHTTTSCDTKHSIPRVPPPEASASLLPPPPIPTAYLRTAPNQREPANSMFKNPRASSAGSDWTLAAGSADQTPMLGQALTTEEPARSGRQRSPSQFEFDHQLPEIARVTQDSEEVLHSPRRKQRSATLTWLRGPWD